MASPNLNRYQSGCAMSPDNQYIYIFGGADVVSPLSQPGNGTVRETERYCISNNQWVILPNGDLNQARFGLFSFVSPTDNAIYLYGGFVYDPTTNLVQEAQDASSMVVFDLDLERVLDLENEQPRWDSGHTYFGLSNTLCITDVCSNEIGISIGSLDFNMSIGAVNDIQLLRFGDIYNYYPDHAITIESSVDIENKIWQAYDVHLFEFTITTTTGADFVPNDDPLNYEMLVTDWQGVERDMDGLNRRYTGRGNGNRDIITIVSVESEDIELFNRCNGISNVVSRIYLTIRIRRQGRRNYLCGQTRETRLRRWMFRDSDLIMMG